MYVVIWSHWLILLYLVIYISGCCNMLSITLSYKASKCVLVGKQTPEPQSHPQSNVNPQPTPNNRGCKKLELKVTELLINTDDRSADEWSAEDA